jgi:hypothetical protein
MSCPLHRVPVKDHAGTAKDMHARVPSAQNRRTTTVVVAGFTYSLRAAGVTKQRQASEGGG